MSKNKRYIVQKNIFFDINKYISEYTIEIQIKVTMFSAEYIYVFPLKRDLL